MSTKQANSKILLKKQSNVKNLNNQNIKINKEHISIKQAYNSSGSNGAVSNQQTTLN